MTLSRQDRWNIHIQALRQFTDRTGTSLVPTTHIEQVGGHNIALGAWVAYNRQQKRQGRLSRERVEELSEFVGWVWEKQKPGKHDNPERDAVIVGEYRSGVSARDLATRHKLSRQRVHQIVRNAQGR
jgi:Mor family transcriptional regulator